MSDINAMISCCGSDCSTCYCFGNMCRGCNAVCGKVFHMPEGKECPIYYCCKIEKGFKLNMTYSCHVKRDMIYL